MSAVLCKNSHQERWELERSFDGQLCQDCSKHFF